MARGFPGATSVEEPTCQCQRPRFHLRVGKIPWRRIWQPIQYSCLENPVDRGAWRATVHGVAKSDTSAHTKTHIDQNGLNRDKGKYSITATIRARESRIKQAHWFCGVTVFKALREDRNSHLQRTAWSSHRACGRGG